MLDWWENLSLLSKLFYYIAIPSTTILFIQSIMTIIGVGASMGGDADFDLDMGSSPEMDLDGDLDLDLDGDGIEDFENLAGVADFRFVTVRGIIAFLTMFGWVGAALANSGIHAALAILGATLAGLISMFLIAMLFYSMTKLQSSGNISYKGAIGKDATVYIPIPANQSGVGKVQLLLQERLIEVSAVTDQDSIIPTGTQVRVIDLLNATTFVVERL